MPHVSNPEGSSLMNSQSSSRAVVIEWLQKISAAKEAPPTNTKRKRRLSHSQIPSPPHSNAAQKRHEMTTASVSPQSALMDDNSTAVRTPKKRKTTATETTPTASSSARQDSNEDEAAQDTSRVSTRHRLQYTAELVSRSSKSKSRSRASGSVAPTKQLATLALEPEGVDIKRLDLDDSIFPTSASNLIIKMQDVAAGQGVVDASLQPAIESLKTKSHVYDSFRPYVYAQEQEHGSSTGTGLLDAVLQIVDVAGECHVLDDDDENCWNHLVHTPLLRAAVSSRIGDYVGWSPCMNAAILPEWRFHPLVTGKVDYVLHIDPTRRPLAPTLSTTQQQQQQQQQLQSSRDVVIAALDRIQRSMPELSVNHTDYNRLRRRPICVSIETEHHGGGQERKAELQLAVWLAAQWKTLSELAGEEGIAELEFLPGVVVQGHSWKLVITTYHAGKTIIWSNIQFGSTVRALETFQIVAGLRVLKRWAAEVFGPWYEKHVLRIGEDLLERSS